ncbi:transcriptional regulator [Afipia sp. Root123D2]|uniref:LuxR family transcriptional regulator n=1 Tax=Afipia sp. Root123D2 TaxID=1736436 RepID=UPI0006FA46E0|nr:LuxR family transcriptional regulator [Afipia sp. Root123D2]KQW22636.1 transcriptional regulator [Afipia sp. Root123D2]
MVAVDYGRDAFDFIDGLNRHTTVVGVMDDAERAFNRFGFETIIVAGLPLNPNGDFSSRVMAKRWPAGWFDLYTQNDYEHDDPVVRHCRRTTQPFEWAEAPYDRIKEPRAAEVMNRATDFRMSKGFITPIHGLGGFKAVVSLGGQNIDLNLRSKPALHIMSLYAFEAICTLMDSQPATSYGLTPRERETLSWASQGKTAYEIGAILHIGQRTVEEHLTTAARKLGASNRTHAVAIAIRNRIIVP